MKLEKREISLNEADSLFDAVLMENNLLVEYVQAMQSINAKSTRETLLSLLEETVQELFFVRDLKKSVEE